MLHLYVFEHPCDACTRSSPPNVIHILAIALEDKMLLDGVSGPIKYSPLSLSEIERSAFLACKKGTRILWS